MNPIKYVQRQLNRLKIDLLTQRTFLAGGVPSIDNNHIIKTVSTNYEELELIFFEQVPLNPNDIIIDVGCGKGRVFSYLLYKGLKNKMIGYEINPAVSLKTEKRLARYPNVHILTENIFDNFPTEGNVFYLYNPFKETMVSQFAQEILKLKSRAPIIIYNNPIHLAVFINQHFTCESLTIPVARFGYTFTCAIIRLRQTQSHIE